MISFPYVRRVSMQHYPVRSQWKTAERYYTGKQQRERMFWRFLSALFREQRDDA